MVNKTLKRAAIGFLLGMVAGNAIAMLTGHPNTVSSTLLERAGSLQAALVMQTLLSGLIGAAGFAGVSLYEIERWPLLLTTSVHYAAYIIVFLIVGGILGWMTSPTEYLIMAAIMCACHLVIFLIMCARYRAEVRELNEMQKQYLNDNENGGKK